MGITLPTADEYCFLCVDCIPHSKEEHKRIMDKMDDIKLERMGWGSTLIDEISMCNT